MNKKLKFLKVSSVILKIAAWIFLFIGIIAGISVLVGAVIVEYPRWIGIVIILAYILSFIFFYTVAIVTDFVIEMKKKED